MRTLCLSVVGVSLCLSSEVFGDEPIDVATAFQQIVADQQRVMSEVRDSRARAAAERQSQLSFQQLIDKAAGLNNLDADDLYALGACHEQLGHTALAKEHYTQSLSQTNLAKTHLALARVNSIDNLKAAESHFVAAIELQPDHPDIPRLRMLLAAMHARHRDWEGAIRHLELYLAYTKSLVDQQPSSQAIRVGHQTVMKQLERLRRFAGMTGKPAPAINIVSSIQGQQADVSQSRGRIVLLDFCAIWAVASRERMQQLQELHQKYSRQGLEIVGLTLAYQHAYDSESDRVTEKAGLSLAEEQAGIAAYAQKHGITYRLAVIDPSVTEEFGVVTIPHTVILDRSGNVSEIVLTDDKQGTSLLEGIVQRMLAR